MDYHVYILSTKRRDTFATGVTNNITHCLTEQQIQNGQLVYFETYDRMDAANQREESIKQHEKDQTVALVENLNPDWEDLFPAVTGCS